MRGRKVTLPGPTPRNCLACGKEFTPIRKKYKQKYCSLACQRATFFHTKDNKELSRKTAEQRGNTLRGKGEGKSYTKYHGKHMHRVLAEKKIGRKLLPGEVVHHKNGNKLDNSLSNLEVMTQSEHINLHRNDLEKGKRARGHA